MTAEPKYDMTVYPMTVAVRSASNGARTHLVQLLYCDCEDFTNRRGRLTAEGTVTVCKHIREALERVGGWHRQPGPESVTVMVHDNLLRESAVGVIADAGISRDTALAGLLRATRGAPASFPRSGWPAVTAEVTGERTPQRYRVTVPV